MNADLALADDVVRSILTSLNGGVRDWQVLDAHYHRGQGIDDEPPAAVDELAPDEEPPTTVLVRIAADAEVIGAHFVLALPLQRAIVATADQLQDQVVEATQGEVVPSCPGHPHPLQAQEVDGVANWVCPKDSGLYRVRIVASL